MPWLQLGPIPPKTYPFLGTSCKAFSLLSPRQACLFCDTNANTYYLPALIRAGIKTLPELLHREGGDQSLTRKPCSSHTHQHKAWLRGTFCLVLFRFNDCVDGASFWVGQTEGPRICFSFRTEMSTFVHQLGQAMHTTSS